MNQLQAQKKCATVEYNQLLKKQLKKPESEKIFENWIKQKSLDRKVEQSISGNQVETLYTIPVVIHVIHKGEALNSSGNISDEIIFAQIDSLNKDFRKLNADTLDTPVEFKPVAADINIEFILAKRDPEGLPTTGIIRKQGNKDTYGPKEGLLLKSQSYWPAEDYLNIWITDISSGFLGYAQFPTSNIEGLDDEQSISRLTDGVVLDWRFTGTNFNTGTFASLGRTATHEMGHFLGLRHIWGDGGCGVDDFCADTPLQGGSTDGCPGAGSQASCSSEDMFQNFMDFSDDVCMNLFTTCQADRMRIVLENSPRRKSLISSKGGTEPVFVSNDLGIREILAPQSGACDLELVPQVEVRNYGSNTITSFTIDLFVDNNLIESVDRNISLDQLSTNLVSFNPVSNVSSTTPVFRFEIRTTNGITDGNSENNIKSVVVNFPAQVSIPYTEDFSNNAVEWTRINSNNDNSSTAFVNAPNITFDNTSFSFNYFGNAADKFGEQDWLISPVFDFSALPSADLNFKYAYAPLTENITDVLTIAISTDCGATFREEDYIFQKFSPALGTTTTTSTSFTPEGPSDWTQVILNLADFAGNSNVVIAFIGHNGNGNNLYLDDIEIISDNILAYNLGISGIASMPLSVCTNDIFPTIQVKNFGFETITDFDLKYTFLGNTETISTNNTTLLPGKTKSVLVPIADILPGEYQIQFELMNPNGNMDQQTSNDILIRNFNISESKDVIPIREDFEGEVIDLNWDFIRADAIHNLSVIETQGNPGSNKSLFSNNYALSNLGIENWLISPTLDFSQAGGASMIFKVSHANVVGRDDRLEVKVSTNCGMSFDHTVYSKKGASLAVRGTINEWFPENEDDWKTEFLDLSDFAVWPALKVAFVITNQNGNNIFLDDIEFFNSNSPTLVNVDQNQILLFPNPANDFFKAKFNLGIKDDLNVTLINMAGSIVYNNDIPNVLNQELNVEVRTLDNGIYILRASGQNTSISKRILVDN